MNSSKKLVAYFSASGVTAGVAKEIASTLGADIFEIEPKKPYSSADLDWTNKKSRSSLEYADASIRPEIKNKAENMAQYDTVLLGFPIWWYTAPSIIKTFLEQYDFSGKTIILFATSGGSGLGRTQSDLEKVINGNAIWHKSGKRLSGKSDAISWAKSLNI